MTDQDYWTRMCEGDEDAFGALYNSYAGLLFGYGMKIIQDEDLITESIQDLFIQLFRTGKALAQPISVGAYLCVSLKRIVLRKAAAKKSLRLLRDEEYPGQFGLEVDYEAETIRTEERQLRLDALQRALDSLTDSQRELIYLRFYQKMSCEEVAQIIGTNSQVVRNLTSRVIKRLRESDALVGAMSSMGFAYLIYILL